MGRAQYTEPVGRKVTLNIGGTNYNVFDLLDNVQITVWKLNPDGSRQATAANIFASRTGAAPFAGGNPFITANGGKTGFWADAGEYEIDFHDLTAPARIGDQTIGWQALGGNEQGVATSQLPNRGEALAPAGVVLPYAGGAEPAGWLFADGRVLANGRANYPALFAAVGTLYNTGGEAGTDFRLPDLRGRLPHGADDFGTQGAAGRLSSLGAGARTRGQSGGADTVALATTHMPAHSHGVTDPSHGHNVHSATGPSEPNDYPNNTNLPGYTAGAGDTVGGVVRRQFETYLGSEASGTGISIQSAGSGTAHNNLGPYQLCNYIIKT